MPGVHRHGDGRSCSATTTVTGQSNVYINGRLASVLGDPNTHGGGALNASNTRNVYINSKKISLQGSSAAPDSLCPIPGGPHCNPKATGASPNVFAND